MKKVLLLFSISSVTIQPANLVIACSMGKINLNSKKVIKEFNAGNREEEITKELVLTWFCLANETTLENPKQEEFYIEENNKEIIDDIWILKYLITPINNQKYIGTVIFSVKSSYIFVFHMTADWLTGGMAGIKNGDYYKNPLELGVKQGEATAELIAKKYVERYSKYPYSFTEEDIVVTFNPRYPTMAKLDKNPESIKVKKGKVNPDIYLKYID